MWHTFAPTFLRTVVVMKRHVDGTTKVLSLFDLNIVKVINILYICNTLINQL